MKKILVSISLLIGLFLVGCAGVPNNPVKFVPNSAGHKNGINARPAAPEPGVIIPVQQTWVANDNPAQWSAPEYQSPTRYTPPPQDAPFSGTFADYIHGVEIAEAQHRTALWAERAQQRQYQFSPYGYGMYNYSYPYGYAGYGGYYDDYPYGTYVPYWKDLQCPPTTRFSYSEGYISLGGRVSIGGHGHRSHGRR